MATSQRALCAVTLVMTLCVACGQWANSINWGGAGLGKRAQNSAILAQILRQAPYGHGDQGDQNQAMPSKQADDRPLSPMDCQADPTVVKLVRSIIREEEERIQRCLGVI